MCACFIFVVMIFVSVYVSIAMCVCVFVVCRGVVLCCLFSSGVASCGICVSVSAMVWVLSAAREKESVRQSNTNVHHLRNTMVDIVLR